MNIDEKVKKVEKRISERNVPVKEVKFRDSLPSKISERIDDLEDRVTNIELELKQSIGVIDESDESKGKR